MPKKKEKEVKVIKEEPKKQFIGFFTEDFNREDLNKLRDKLNEVIEFLNIELLNK